MPAEAHTAAASVALDQRCVDQPGVVVGAPFEHVADREDRAAEIAEQDHAVAAVDARDRLANALAIGAETPVRTAADRHERNLGTGQLTGQIDDAAGELRTM